MEDFKKRINELSKKLDILSIKNEFIFKSILEIKQQIQILKDNQENTHTNNIDKAFEPDFTVIENPENDFIKQSNNINQSEENLATQSYHSGKTKEPKVRKSIEKFIGENLIVIAGVIITVIGVGIGAKYSIDHKLVSPVARIVIGYILGLGLLFFALKLRKKYENFSAALISGSAAIMYFVTYSAYTFYGLLYQETAFILMLIFTIFTVYIALSYNKQIIALIGLVGAYAVPFLLSEGSGKVLILFTYMTIINIGILVIAIKKYWKLLYFSSFIISWLIYYIWFNFKYQMSIHFEIALAFLAIFFTLFYIIIIINKLLQNKKYEFEDIAILLANSFIFYGLGYAILIGYNQEIKLTGLFTLLNGLIHIIVALIIFLRKIQDKNLQYLLTGLFVVFITISIPIELDGNWVTLLWGGESLVLFWIGRIKKIFFYEIISYIMISLAFFSCVYYWLDYNHLFYSVDILKYIPFYNEYFLTSVLFTFSIILISLFDNKNKLESNSLTIRKINRVGKFIIWGVILIASFVSVYIEIEMIWGKIWKLEYSNIINLTEYNFFLPNDNFLLINSLNDLSLLIYTLIFVFSLSILNLKKIKSKLLGKFNIILNFVITLTFLLQGLPELSNIRELYIDHSVLNNDIILLFYSAIRLLSYLIFALALYSIYKYSIWDELKLKLKIPFEIFLHTSILWLISYELINWMEILTFTQSDKLGLSRNIPRIT
ncbi:MAG: DUF2339 domain-containing protein [Bacteroidetes bacterium]|nr:DUF2339 domain-containing protein [Bacteroidota bacterium]